MSPTPIPCRVCGAATVLLGTKRGQFEPREFHLHHCPSCHFSFIADPWTDYEKIYSADYYAGRGADPLVDYVFELEHPDRTIRIYEWRGIVRAVQSLYRLAPGSRWLDYGCGNGGLVRHVLANRLCQAEGFEEGWIAAQARASGIPILDDRALDSLTAAFDVVTAIDVIEHVADPIAVMRRVRSLLKPGGLFFFTTANAEPLRSRLLAWRYVLPEVHIGFFEPATAAAALTRAGFQPEFRPAIPGFGDIIRFKVLKKIGVSRRSWIENMLPWRWMSHLVDVRLKVSALPVGWAPRAAE